MTSLVIPDLIRDPLHPYVRMRLRVESAMTSLVIPGTSRHPGRRPGIRFIGTGLKSAGFSSRSFFLAEVQDLVEEHLGIV